MIDKIFYTFEFIILALTVIFLAVKLFIWIKDLIRGKSDFGLSKILEILKFGIPIVLSAYLLTQIYDSNLNIFCKILLVCLFVVLGCIYLHFEGEKKYYIFKILKGYPNPDIAEWLTYIKEHQNQLDEDIVIDAIRHYKNQIEFEYEIKKGFHTKDDLLKALKSSDYYKRNLAFLKFPKNIQAELLKSLIEENYPCNK